MKLLQWNVWCLEDPANVVETIADIKPDALCLQEVTLQLESGIS